MGKWSFITIILFVVAYVLPQGSKRYPASGQEPTGNKQNCMQIAMNFAYPNGFNVKAYSDAIDRFNELKHLSKVKKFKNAEEYVAWIDIQAKAENISLGEFLATRSKKSHLMYNFFIKRSMPGKFGNFLFDDIFDEILLKSVKVEGLDPVEEKTIIRVIQEKLALEAIEKIHKLPDGRLAKLYRSTLFQHFDNLMAMVIPLIFHAPPIRLPRLISRNEEAIMALKNVEDMRAYVEELSGFDRLKLDYKMHYNTIRRYYMILIGAYYIVDTAIDIYELEEYSSLVDTLSEATEEMVNETLNADDPCYPVKSCMEKYRDKWEGKSDEVYGVFKAACFKTHVVSESCE